MTDSNIYLANLLGALALALSDRQREACEQAAGQGGAAGAVLTAIAQYPGENLGFFEPILGLTSSGIVRLLDRLVGAGLVERRLGADARTRAIHLTASGRAAVEAIQTARRATMTEALTPLCDTERRQLTTLVDKMLAGLTETRLQARQLCRLCDHRHCDDAGRCPIDRAVTAAGDPGRKPRP
jgi:DNA-binding MarR family transcriptional regulator